MGKVLGGITGILGVTTPKAVKPDPGVVQAQKDQIAREKQRDEEETIRLAALEKARSGRALGRQLLLSGSETGVGQSATLG